MKNTFLIIFTFLTGIQFNLIQLAHAALLTKDPNFSYEVYFTNPYCDTYYYESGVKSNDGSLLKSKPKNAYCKASDKKRNINRDDAPLKNLLKVINDKKNKEFFLTYLSFSSSDVFDALCNALKTRDIKLTFFIDRNNDGVEADPSQMEKFTNLANCPLPGSFSALNLKLELKGGQNGIGYAHNKIMMVNYTSPKVTLIFSSANMSSGTVTHHENWHFITASQKSYFIQSHLCLMEGMNAHEESKDAYIDFIQSCRKQIKTEPESDMISYFIPGDGNIAYRDIEKEFAKSQIVNGAAHRFSNRRLGIMMENFLKVSKNNQLNFVFDDDLYWTGKLNTPVGRNSLEDWNFLAALLDKGLYPKYMETFHHERTPFLHHNKYFIFKYNNSIEIEDPAVSYKGSVFTGAGNLTGAAFSRNFENFYMIKIPNIVSKFMNQYEYVWTKLATPVEKMPLENILP